jgi:hypothetical protein
LECHTDTVRHRSAVGICNVAYRIAVLAGNACWIVRV